MDNLTCCFMAEDNKESLPSNDCDYSLPEPVNCVLTLETKCLHHLPDSVFQTSELKDVKEIILDGSSVEKLPRSFSSNLQNLEVMRIEKNKLNELPKHLKYLQFLKYLSAPHNNLSDLPDDISCLVNLEYLDVSFNALHLIPECIASLVNLKHLNVCNNCISKLPDEIGALVKLEHLDVSNNIILILPSSVSNLKNLTYLNLSSNSLSELPDSLHLSKLRTLLLCQNVFKNVPDCIIHCLNFISILDLSHNKIMFFDLPPKCVSNLIKLDISNNVFHDIPLWLFGEKCRFLRELNISDNKHMIGTSEPSAYSKCGDVLGVSTSLKVLKASNCCFSSSSVEFLYGLKALESLTLGNEVICSKESNHIGNILFNFPSKTLNTCTNLKYLNMNNVGLADLPQDIGNLSKLEILDISFNQLMSLPDSFCKLVTLTKLQVSNNELRILPSEFGQLATLEELKLDGNKLQSLPDSFKKLKKLRVLDLYDNIFNELPLVVMDLSALEEMDADFNLFSVDNSSGQACGTFLEKYKLLKCNMRRKIALQNSNLKREDGKKRDSEENNSEEGDNALLDAYDLEEVSSDEFIEQESVPVCEENGRKNDDVENWDVSDDSDSHFDPHFQKKKPPASYGPSLLVYDAVSTSPEHFCPADLHSEPIRRGRKNYEVRHVAEGQFDDADI